MSSFPSSQHVQNFGHAIADYLSAYRHQLDEFRWPMEAKCIETAVDRNLLLTPASTGGFAETIQLRAAVAARARELQEAPDPRRMEGLTDLARFVISDWGNLKGNKPQTISEYVERFTGEPLPFDQIRSARDLRAAVPRAKQRGLFHFSGIASWSKWLNFVWNDWALIYDARIAFALDAIHFISRVDAPVFRVPVGRNPQLANLDARSCAAFGWIGSYGGESGASARVTARLEAALVPRNDTYCYYLAVMAVTHRRLWNSQKSTPLVHTEMLLFMLSITSIADDFASELLARLATAGRGAHIDLPQLHSPNQEKGAPAVAANELCLPRNRQF